MTFLIILFPLLAYVFIPRVASSSGFSENANSDKGNVQIPGKRSDIENPFTAQFDMADRMHEHERGIGNRLRHARSHSNTRRHFAANSEDETKGKGVEKDAFEMSTTTDVGAQQDASETLIDDEPQPEGIIGKIGVTDDDRNMSSGHTTMATRLHDHTSVEDFPTNYTDNSYEYANGTNSVLSSGPEITAAPVMCPKCGSIGEQKRLYVEVFKQTLLQKLGMTIAPKVGGPLPPLPYDFYLGEDFSVNDEPDEKAKERRIVKTRQVFIFGTDVTHRCHNQKGTGCYSFNLTDKGIDADEVASVYLWIYKQQDLNDHHIQTFMVSELDKSGKKIKGEPMLRHKNIAKRIETRLKDGWMKIYVKRTVMRWLSKPQRNNGLAVVCKTCQRKNHKTIYGYKEGMLPILVFYMRHNRHHRPRYRRETQCNEGGNNCCHMESLVINFHDIGWDYIMAPASIRPNFCTGSCNGIHAAYYNHTRLVQTLQQSVIHTYSSQLQPCCSPVSFRQQQSLIYRDHHGVVRKIDVPDLIVGECGCI